MARVRTAVLISGGGSNLQALLDAACEPGYPAEIVLVLSDVADAYGLERARRAGVATMAIDPRCLADRAAVEAAIDDALTASAIELLCLAGFMRILSEGFVARWHDRMLNIHPSLLPAFRGLRTHERAHAAGVRLHGCTVHLVRPALDDGPILVQGVLPVSPGDGGATLAARVLELEHRCYPRALRLWAGGLARLEDGRIVGAEAERLILHDELRRPAGAPDRSGSA